MPQVIPLLPTFPSKTMFGSLSSDTIKLRQEKLSHYLSKLIKIPEVWRSPEMADFLDDSAKILANLTVNLRVERIVHMQRLVMPSKCGEDVGVRAMRTTVKNSRGSFHTVSPLEATGVNFFGNTTAPAVKPRRKSLLAAEGDSAGPTSSFKAESKSSSSAAVLRGVDGANVAASLPLQDQALQDAPPPRPPPAPAPSDESEDEHGTAGAPPPPPPPPPTHASSDESEDAPEGASEVEDEHESGVVKYARVLRPAPPSHAPPSSAEDHSSAEEHSSADEFVEVESFGFGVETAAADVAAGSLRLGRTGVADLWKRGAEFVLGGDQEVNIPEEKFRGVVVTAVTTRNVSMDVGPGIPLPAPLPVSASEPELPLPLAGENAQILMEGAQHALDDIEALERAGMLSMAQPVAHHRSAELNTNTAAALRRQRSSHHAVIHVNLPKASTPTRRRITVTSDPVVFETLHHPETGMLRAGIQLAGPDLKAVEAKWKEYWAGECKM